jgi:hypothetical protein
MYNSIRSSAFEFLEKCDNLMINQKLEDSEYFCLSGLIDSSLNLEKNTRHASDELNGYLFITKKISKKHEHLLIDCIEKRENIRQQLYYFDNKFGTGKRIFSEFDPYGEENWEE